MQMDPASLGAILQSAVQFEAEGNYQPWDLVRRLSRPEHSTEKQWWGAIQLVRGAGLKEIPLRDCGGKSFRYAVTDVMAQRLHQIDLGAGGAIGMPEPITNPQTRSQYVMRSLFQEAVTSSQLEGAATTRAQAKELLRSGRTPRTRGERMILNNYLTMQRIAEWKEKPLDVELLLEIQRMVTDGTLDNPDAAGRLRNTDEPVSIQDEITGEVYHRPPPAEELTNRVSALCDFANGVVSQNASMPIRFVHPAVRAILLHFWLAYDHPFVDGNGRTARALFYWSMLRQGYWLFEFVSISEILLKAPARYALSYLHTETDNNDVTYFLIHQTEVIDRAIKALHSYIEHKSTELRETETLLRHAQTLNHRQQAIVGHALRHPGARYTIAGHRRSHSIAYETARKDLLELAARNLLESGKNSKAIIFIAPSNMAERVQLDGLKA